MATNNSIKFCRVDGITYENLVAGAVYFDSESGMIHIATSNTTTDKFGGNISDANWDEDSSALNITKNDGTIITLDFSDMASASAVMSALNTKADKEEVAKKQDKLVSGTNIKTINGESLIGSGDITIESGDTLTEADITAMGFTKNAGTYSKPSGGIPKSDLASAVQTSLGKADTALQSYTEQYKGTITGVSANGTSVATSGVANIPAASTSAYGVTKLSSATNSTSTTLAATASAVKAAYDLANGKQDKLVSGTNIKTVNGTSILGSGDIAISGGSSGANVQAVDTGDVLDDINVDYATKTYVDGLIGDINSVLESIISGGIVNDIFPITLTIGDNGQAAIDLYNYVVQNYDGEMYSFKENEIVKYNSATIPCFYYSVDSTVIRYPLNGGVLVVNSSGRVMYDMGAD